MLPRTNRIERGAFKKLSRGPVYHSKHLILVSYHGDLGQSPRFAFSVSKKVAASAVDRNTMRRRVYSALQRLAPDMKQGFIGHISAKKGLKIISFQDLFIEVRELIVRSGGLGRQVEEGVKIR